MLTLKILFQFFEWTQLFDRKENDILALRCVDKDLTLCVDEPATLTESNMAEQEFLYEKWEQSNYLSLMFIKTYF